MAKRKKTDRVAIEQGGARQGPFNTAFAGLASLSVTETSPPARSAAPVAPARAEPETPSPFAGKLVLRQQRKGHGGKTVTTVEGLPTDAVEQIASDIGKALGTGARAVDATVVVAGDQRERLAEWLKGRGGSRIVMGN